MIVISLGQFCWIGQMLFRSIREGLLPTGLPRLVSLFSISFIQLPEFCTDFLSTTFLAVLSITEPRNILDPYNLPTCQKSHNLHRNTFWIKHVSLLTFLPFTPQVYQKNSSKNSKVWKTLSQSKTLHKHSLWYFASLPTGSVQSGEKKGH